jgi:hypothetical protein
MSSTKPAHNKLLELIEGFTQLSSDITDKAPSWDTSPILSPVFYDKLCEWLLKQDNAFEPLTTLGYAPMGSKLAASSPEHAIALATDTVTMHTVQNPSPLVFVPNAAASAHIDAERARQAATAAMPAGASSTAPPTAPPSDGVWFHAWLRATSLQLHRFT